jgi:hypothetical protein
MYYLKKITIYRLIHNLFFFTGLRFILFNTTVIYKYSIKWQCTIMKTIFCRTIELYYIVFNCI